MLPLSELFSLSGKVALVTGASSSIGRLMASTLAEAGAAVVLLARDVPRLSGAVAQIRAEGGRAHALALDLRDRTQLDAAATGAAESFGAPDILVNAAGVNPRPLVENITPEMWEEVMAVNLEAPFFLAQRLAPSMRAAAGAASSTSRPSRRSARSTTAGPTAYPRAFTTGEQNRPPRFKVGVQFW